MRRALRTYLPSACHAPHTKLERAGRCQAALASCTHRHLSIQTWRSTQARLTAPRPLRAPTPRAAATEGIWKDRYGNEPRKGSDILVQAMEREGVDQVHVLLRACKQCAQF